VEPEGGTGGWNRRVEPEGGTELSASVFTSQSLIIGLWALRGRNLIKTARSPAPYLDNKNEY